MRRSFWYKDSLITHVIFAIHHIIFMIYVQPSRKFWTSPSKLIYTHLLFVLSKITYFPIYYIVTSQFELSWKGFVSTKTIIALGRLAKKMQIESSILWCAKKLSAFITHNKSSLVVILSFAKKQMEKNKNENRNRNDEPQLPLGSFLTLINQS